MQSHAHTRTHTHTHNHFTALWILSGTSRVSRYQKKHSPTHIYRGHQSSLICFIHLIWSTESSLFNLQAWQSFPQSLSKFCLVYLLAWHPPFHTPYISSPNRCLLFAAHAHTIATCFAVVPRLSSNLSLSLNPLFGTQSCSFTPHIHLTILISARWSATSFSFLTGQVSLTYYFAHNCHTISLSQCNNIKTENKTIKYMSWLNNLFKGEKLIKTMN